MTPAWFTRALESAPGEATVEADGCPIHYLEWGEAGAPGLVFLHGGAAHAHWWSFLAPLFAHRRRVLALDLSGHGDSGRRPAYSMEGWADEVMAVVSRAAFPRPPVVVGHSMGGLVAVQAAAAYCEALGGVVLVDAPVPRPDPESQAASRRRVFRSPGVYPTLEEALEHFRLVPDQPVANGFIVDHIARHSLRQVPGGWTWKFDPTVFLRQRSPINGLLAAVRCPLALIYGEQSEIVPPESAAYMQGLMGEGALVIPIPEAHHHLTLDQPLAFVAALRTLLPAWEHPGRPGRGA